MNKQNKTVIYTNIRADEIVGWGKNMYQLGKEQNKIKTTKEVVIDFIKKYQKKSPSIYEISHLDKRLYPYDVSGFNENHEYATIINKLYENNISVRLFKQVKALQPILRGDNELELEFTFGTCVLKIDILNKDTERQSVYLNTSNSSYDDLTDEDKEGLSEEQIKMIVKLASPEVSIIKFNNTITMRVKPQLSLLDSNRLIGEYENTLKFVKVFEKLYYVNVFRLLEVK